LIPRLTTRAWVSALVRRVNAAGDFATVVARGDDTAGAISLLIRRRDGSCAVLARVSQQSGEPAWKIFVDEPAERVEIVNDYLEKQRRFDPDLWIIELDTANPERFIDEPILTS